jgi:predicted MFS family arabinose efflux permease
MPVIIDAFQINLTQAGALMSIIALIGLVLALPAGIILQRLGPWVTGLVALGCMAGGSVLGALSGGYAALMGSRIVEGIGVGLIGVVAPATISMWFPPSRQGMPMGIWATWVPVGSVMVFTLAPALLGTRGWQAAWWIGAGFALLMMVFYGFLVRRPPLLREPGTADPPRSQAAFDLRKALANRDIWLLALEFACFSLALTAVGTYYPTFLSEVRGYSLPRAAFIASLMTLMILVSAPLAGVLSDRIGSRRLVFSLPFLGIAFLLVFPFQVTGWGIVALMIMLGSIIGGIPTATFTAAPEVMRNPQWAGLGLAVILIGQNLGQLVGPVLFGQLVNSQGWAVAGYAMIPVCLLGFLSGWMVRVR